MTNFSPCSGWDCCHWGSWLGGGAVSLGAAMSSNQVGRTGHLLHWRNLRFLMLSLRRLWQTGGIIHASTNTVINCTFQMTCRLCGWGSRGAPFGEGTLSPLRRYDSTLLLSACCRSVLVYRVTLYTSFLSLEGRI